MSFVLTPTPYQSQLREVESRYKGSGINLTPHLRAIDCPNMREYAIVHGMKGWLAYADTHRTSYGSGIGEDGVLGPAWAQWGDALRQLLNGDCGRLDCGTLDSILCNTLTAEGFNPDDL